MKVFLSVLLLAFIFTACAPVWVKINDQQENVMSVSLHINLTELDILSSMIGELSQLEEEPLLDLVGSEVETQIRNRILHEQTDPDGNPWQEWSPAYEKTRHSGNKKLLGKGDLEDSIQYSLNTNSVEIGSNLIYAAIHNFGGPMKHGQMPQREYLGLSSENQKDLADLIGDFFSDQLQLLA